MIFVIKNLTLLTRIGITCWHDRWWGLYKTKWLNWVHANIYNIDNHKRVCILYIVYPLLIILFVRSCCHQQVFSPTPRRSSLNIWLESLQTTFDQTLVGCGCPSLTFIDSRDIYYGFNNEIIRLESPFELTFNMAIWCAVSGCPKLSNLRQVPSSNF